MLVNHLRPFLLTLQASLKLCFPGVPALSGFKNAWKFEQPYKNKEGEAAAMVQRFPRHVFSADQARGCCSSQRAAQWARPAAPKGQTPSLKRTLGLCAEYAPRSSEKPADRYRNADGTFSAIMAKSSDAFACIPGIGVSPGTFNSRIYPTICSVKSWSQMSGGTADSGVTTALPP